MDEDLNLLDRLRARISNPTLMEEAAAAIARLHAEIEALKSDVDELVRAGSDEATEVERLVKERDEALAEIARRDAVATAKWGDQADEHSAAIRAAHPTYTKLFEPYDRALAMIGNRHGKYELVNLANWLLVRAETAEAQRDAALQLSTLTSSHDEVKALADAIAQRDELRHELVTANICLDKAVKDRDVAREALRPFAVWSSRMPDVVPEFPRDISKVVQIAIANGHLTGEHFRAASRALDTVKEKD